MSVIVIQQKSAPNHLVKQPIDINFPGWQPWLKSSVDVQYKLHAASNMHYRQRTEELIACKDIKLKLTKLLNPQLHFNFEVTVGTRILPACQGDAFCCLPVLQSPLPLAVNQNTHQHTITIQCPVHCSYSCTQLYSKLTLYCIIADNRVLDHNWQSPEKGTYF